MDFDNTGSSHPNCHDFTSPPENKIAIQKMVYACCAYRALLQSFCAIEASSQTIKERPNNSFAALFCFTIIHAIVGLPLQILKDNFNVASGPSSKSVIVFIDDAT